MTAFPGGNAPVQGISEEGNHRLDGFFCRGHSISHSLLIEPASQSRSVGGLGEQFGRACVILPPSMRIILPSPSGFCWPHILVHVLRRVPGLPPSQGICRMLPVQWEPPFRLARGPGLEPGDLRRAKGGDRIFDRSLCRKWIPQFLAVPSDLMGMGQN